MKEIDRSKPVLVTGGGGYIASWIIQYLLEDGISVRATVRDKLDSKKNISSPQTFRTFSRKIGTLRSRSFKGRIFFKCDSRERRSGIDSSYRVSFFYRQN